MANSKLPPRWRYRLGAYRYRPHPDQRHLWDNKTEFKLGKTEAEAWRTWFERTDGMGTGDVITMHDVFEQFFVLYVQVELKETTRESYRHHLKSLKKAFGHMRPSSLLPTHAYQYRTKRAEKARVSANREVSILTSALTFAVERGWITTNPLRGQISRRGTAAERPRTRVPTFEELERFCDVNPKLRGFVALKTATGLRRGQLLSIDLNEHWDGEVLHPPTSKGSKDTQYLGARRIIELILKDRLPTGPLFYNQKGNPHSKSGFDSSWQRAMVRFVKAGGEKFNEHDIRKTVANEASNLEHAQKLLGHQDSKTTSSTYRIGRPQKVNVLKREK